MKLSCSLPLLLSALLFPTGSLAAPAHAICEDLGPALGVGVSSFSSAGDWPVVATTQHGVTWKFLYLYLVPVSDPKPDQQAFLLDKVNLANSLGAIPVFTFYQLLQLGQQNGVSGTEPEVVQQVLQDAALMHTYFDNFVFVLQTAEMADVPVLVHVEPDSWGFMMWAMGVDGNSDATSVPVAVAGSGHPDVAGFPDHAGGLGQALLKLRDQHAPSVRMGWHASNFRVGQRPDVVASFYASMGEWDVLFSEEPHLEADESTWWNPWDESLVDTNLSWLSTVTSSAKLPLLMWQAQIGTVDWHMFAGDTSMLSRFAQAGLAGVMFDMRGTGNPDDFRAYESAALATVPPASSMAGGTAADMRARLAAYSSSPLSWPVGAPCAAGGGTGGGAGTGTGAGSGAGGAGNGGGGAGASAGQGSEGGGCGCRAAEAAESASGGLLLGLALLASARRRRSTMRSRGR